VFYFIKTPSFLRHLYAKAIWQLPNRESKIYLTFDDGPVEGITDKALDILLDYGVKATFFCVGQNIERNPMLFKRMLDEGHEAGNHSYTHLNGWYTDDTTYYDNIAQARACIPSILFRPPYGKIKRSQLAHLSQHYHVIMWDVLSGDFDPKTSAQQVINNVVEYTTEGAIIVMHDNEKCGQKMLEALPVVLEKLLEKGYSFSVIRY
jgi:peptidoglycan-N-acetylglucosamine deacetylase